MASSGSVLTSGWHDTYFRWDISTPQAIVGRLEALPGQGTMRRGKKLFAERGRFGKWDHLLGQENVLLSYAVASLGVTDRVYTPETARRRRKLARSLGVAVTDAEVEPLDIALDELLEMPRSAWSA